MDPSCSRHTYGSVHASDVYGGVNSLPREAALPPKSVLSDEDQSKARTGLCHCWVWNPTSSQDNVTEGEENKQTPGPGRLWHSGLRTAHAGMMDEQADTWGARGSRPFRNKLRSCPTLSTSRPSNFTAREFLEFTPHAVLESFWCHSDGGKSEGSSQGAEHQEAPRSLSLSQGYVYNKMYIYAYIYLNAYTYSIYMYICIIREKTGDQTRELSSFLLLGKITKLFLHRVAQLWIDKYLNRK